jgi:hypothetical protein
MLKTTVILAAGTMAAALLTGAAQAQVDPPLDPADAQTAFRYIGVAPAPPFPPGCTFTTPFCPFAPTWTGSDLLGPAPIPPGLQGLCVYESTGGLVSELDNLVALGCLTSVEPDLMAVTPFSVGGGTESPRTGAAGEVQQPAAPQPFEALVWEPLRDNFLAQAGALPPAAAPVEPLVRLTLLDTQPTAVLDQPGNALHGFTLAEMAEDLICTGENRCGVDIRTRLALPYIDFCPGCTDPNGGYFGTIGELAAAIRAEVSDWEQANEISERRLVLNLSIGWDPQFGQLSLLEPTPAPVLAVFRALQDASCRGALVLAAAGNRFSGPDNTPGPLLPGGWETLPAPDLAYCQANLDPDDVDASDFPDGPAYRPLVYAAGAVDIANRPVLTRVRGEPPRVAYGMQAVTGVVIGIDEEPTEVQTGTSVAAVIASAAAAAGWAYQPDTPAFRLMSQVDLAGDVLPRNAQFCFPPGNAQCNRKVRRLNVCTAVDAVCATDPAGLCPPAGSFACDKPPVTPPPLPFDQIQALFDDPGIPRVSVTELTSILSSPEECGEQWVLRAHPLDIVDVPCPQRQFYGMQAAPWTNPQPASQPCPTCTGEYASPGNLYLEIADEFGGEVSDVTLVCGNLGLRLPDALLPLPADGRFLVTNVPEACAGRLQVAYRVLGTSPDATVSAFSRVMVYSSAP